MLIFVNSFVLTLLFLLISSSSKLIKILHSALLALLCLTFFGFVPFPDNSHFLFIEGYFCKVISVLDTCNSFNRWYISFLFICYIIDKNRQTTHAGNFSEFCQSIRSVILSNIVSVFYSIFP